MADYPYGYAGNYDDQSQQNMGSSGRGMSNARRGNDRNRRRRKPGVDSPGHPADSWPQVNYQDENVDDYNAATASPKGPDDEVPSVSPRKKRNRQRNRQPSGGSQEYDSPSQGSPVHNHQQGGGVTYSDVKNGTYQNAEQDFPPHWRSHNSPVRTQTYHSSSPTHTRVFYNRDHSPRSGRNSPRGRSPMRTGSPNYRHGSPTHDTYRRDDSPGHNRRGNSPHYQRNYSEYEEEHGYYDDRGGNDSPSSNYHDHYDNRGSRGSSGGGSSRQRSRSPGMQRSQPQGSNARRDQLRGQPQARQPQGQTRDQRPPQKQFTQQSMPAAQRFQSPRYSRGYRPLPTQTAPQQAYNPQQGYNAQQAYNPQQAYAGNPIRAQQMAYGMMASMFDPYYAQTMYMQAFQGVPIRPGQNMFAGQDFYKRPPFDPKKAQAQVPPQSCGPALPYPGYDAPREEDNDYNDDYSDDGDDDEGSYYDNKVVEDYADRGQPKTKPQRGRGGGQPPQRSGQQPPQNRTGSGRGGDGGRNNNRNYQQRQPQKREVFESYWDPGQVSEGLKRGTLLQAELRVNPKNYEHCYIAHPDGHSDVFICGFKERNRALNGDVVAVFMHPRPRWKVLVEDLELMEDTLEEKLLDMTMREGKADATDGDDGKEGDEGEGIDNDGERLELRGEDDAEGDGKEVKSSETSKDSSVNPQSARSNDSCTSKPASSRVEDLKQNAGGKKSWTPNKHYTSLEDIVRAPHRSNSSVIRRLFGREAAEAAASASSSQDGSIYGDEDEEEMQRKMDAVPDSVLLRTGKIVYIVERKNNRASVGTIKLMNDKNRHTALFCPSDHRMPRIMIPMSDCPKDFYQRPNDHASTLFIARITEWDDHSQFAKGSLSRSLGEAGEIEPETAGMLIDYDIDSSEFSKEVLDCLPKNLPWQIPEAEYAYRRDLRKHCVFTIDPATARDLDDALHVISLGDGFYEVGVHIADVSYFVPENTKLDRVAASRSTSVYLVQKVIPMLPRLLCEELCSLNPDKDRLTFSVIWKMTDTGEIVDEWFGRSVIRSCVKLAYEHAQGFIDHPDRDWTPDEIPTISEGFTIGQIKESVLNLNKVALQLRKQRFDSGALRLDQVKIQFALDKDSGMPNGYSVYEQKDSNRLIEEFMLLANMAVAHKIYKTFPEIACLRRHPPPQTRMIDELVELCSSLGVDIDASSAGALQRSIARHAGKDLDSRSRIQILTSMCSKPMQNARYFCTGSISDEEVYRHYALNVPLYTHFTSPIRRYPDCMVHRLLAAALGYCGPSKLKTAEVQKQADHCNDKKMASKRVQEQSNELFFCIFVRECGPLREEGMVMGVLDKSFQVLILKLGVIKQVYCDQLPLESFKFMKHGKKPQLTLIWAVDKEHPRRVLQSITIFSPVNCLLVGDNTPLKYNALVLHPNDPLRPK